MKLVDVIEPDYCVCCFKPIENAFFRKMIEGKLFCCNACIKKLNPNIRKLSVKNIKGYGFYHYEDTIKSMIFQYKGCYDIVLAGVFLNHFKWLVKLLCFNKVVVPVPSYKSHDQKRTFNHIKEILKVLNIKYVDCLTKTKNIKQSSNSLKKRKEIGKWFTLNDKCDLLKGKSVILIDDVLTTGSTIEACSNLLNTCKIRDISFIVISYTSR